VTDSFQGLDFLICHVCGTEFHYLQETCPTCDLHKSEDKKDKEEELPTTTQEETNG